MKEATALAIALAALLGICVAQGLAETITFANGVKLEDVEIIKVEPDGIRYMRATGAGKALFAKLTVEEQKKWGYNPEEAKRFTEKKSKTIAMAEAAAEAEKSKKREASENHEKSKQVQKNAEAQMEDLARQNRLTQIEDAMATLLNQTTSRGYKPGKKMTDEEKEFQRTEKGWHPYSPVGHPDLMNTMRGRDLMEEWEKLKYGKEL